MNEAILNLDSLLGYITSLARFLPGLMVPLCRAGLSPTRQLLVTNKLELPLLHGWSHPARPAGVGVQRIHSWVDNFSLLEIHRAPSNTIGAGPLGRAFQVSSSLVHQVLRCGVFSNRTLFSSSGRQTKGNSNSLWFLLLAGRYLGPYPD